MIRTITLIFFLTITFTPAQIVDSVKTKIILLADSTSIKNDSLKITDSSLTIVKPDSVLPVYLLPLTDKSFLISRAGFLKTEYKYTGDYLRLFPFNFIKDLGFPGQPNETFLYGVGNNSVSYLMDGVLLNDPYYNSFNLNLVQSEDIDSIEIITLPRGFLYGVYNNPVSVNFITRDIINIKPYSRIKYYQGPDRETMIDGYFNLHITKKLIASFDITNRIADSTYINTEFSIWQGKVKLKYLLSDNINLIASYSYNDYKVGYSGGVNVDGIVKSGESINNVLYDYRAAPMIYPNGELKILSQLPKLSLLIKPAKWLKTDASFFYMYSQNEKNAFANEYVENKVLGLNIRNNIDYKIFNMQMNFDYENIDQLKHYYFTDSVQLVLHNPVLTNTKYDIVSFAGILSADLSDSKFVPSVFYKYSSINGTPLNIRADLNNNNKSYGFGFDLTYRIINNLNLYAGYSVFKKYFSDNGNLLMEIGANYKSDFLTADLKYFVNQYNYGFYTGGVFFDYISFGNVNGIGLNLKFNYWKFLLESNSSHYFSEDNYFIGVPDYQTQTGLYYKDILFENNLDLKTGFVFYYTGNNNVFTEEHGVLAVPSSYKIDFTLAGEIQGRAIIYFLWQNILDNNYYITPYYPMPFRSIRFGVAWELFN